MQLKTTFFTPTIFLKNHFVLLVISFFIGIAVFADTPHCWSASKKRGPIFATITGTVTNESDEPVSGATVSIKGIKRSVVTNDKGVFSIEAVPGDIIVISAIGFEAIEVRVAESINYTVKMKLKESGLIQVTVLGSRFHSQRTKVETALPVDVLSSADLQRTGQVDVGQMMQFVSPSFNSTKNGINGAANYADPATLRGLSPDQMLVLVNGKRRHQFSALNLNVTLGKGTVATDINAIPSLALDRIEVLRDGAAAQYGSDAIAGITNLSLRNNVRKGIAKIQYGATGKGDGKSFLAALNYGFELGKENSYFNFTLHYQNVEGTDRSDSYTGNIYIPTTVANAAAREDSVRAAKKVWPTKASNTPFKVTQYGSNNTKAYQFFINAGYPINDKWSIYAFGGYSYKDVLAYGFFRNAIPSDQNSDTAIAPNGYTPELPGFSKDISATAGIKKEVSNGWNIDISSTYGSNSLDQEANNTANPSLGAMSPRNFYVGQSAFKQSTSEIIISKNLGKSMGLKSFNLAFGGQYRTDRYRLTAGDSNSYRRGTLSDAVTSKKAPGSSGRPGISPDDQIDTTRSNVGAFIDIETDLSKKFLAAIAFRYENYSDFGGNLSGKLALRYELSEHFSLRGSINRGFRAASLQQIYNSVTTSTVQSGVISQTKQLRSSDPRLAKLGIQKPKEETSLNYGFGLTANSTNNRWLLTIDAYQIEIRDRIIITENLPVNSSRILSSVFPQLQEISFFTNNINTNTRGLEVVTSYRQKPSGRGFNVSAALSLNKTEIKNMDPSPAGLVDTLGKPLKLLDTISRSLIETSQPRSKFVISLGYKLSKLEFSLRGTYFGSVIAWEKPTTGSFRNHRSQEFSGKALFDFTVTYDIVKALSLSIGVNNFTNVYPDKNRSDYAAYSSGQVPYTRNASQFGFNGSFIYGNLTIKF